MTLIFHRAVWVAFALGLISLSFVYLNWSMASRFYATTWVKPLLSLLKAASTALGVYAKMADPSDADLANRTLLVGIASSLLWEFVDLRCASRREGDRRRAEEDLARREEEIEYYQNQAKFQSKLLAYLNQIVQYKKQRVLTISSKMSRGSYGSQRAAAYEAALDPAEQISRIFQLLATFLHDLGPRGETSDKQNFRIGLYVEVDGLMTPVRSWDHLKKSEQSLRSYQIAPDKFRVDCVEKPAWAVACVQAGKLEIVEDCAASSNFIHPAQDRYLKSLIAYPIFDLPGADDRRIGASLVVDTDVAGHFRESDRPIIDTYMEHFASRLDLETSIQRLLTKPRETTDGARQGRKRS